MPEPAALTSWPKPRKEFDKIEQKAWLELGDALLYLGTVSVADLLMVERAAQVRARVDRMMADKRTSARELGALLRLEKELMIQLGLTPSARKTVSPLKAKNGASRFEEVE